MKKLFTVLSVALLATSMWALPTAPVKKLNRPAAVPTAMPMQMDRMRKQAPAELDLMHPASQEARAFVRRHQAEKTRTPRKAVHDEKLDALYLNPEGSLFCGIDAEGTYFWANYPTIVGSWLNKIDAWKWRNLSTGYTDIEYKNAWSMLIGEDNGTSIDAEGNWCDTIPAIIKSDWYNYEYYSWRVPMQIVDNGLEKDSFILMVEHADQMDTLVENAYLQTVSGMKCLDWLSPNGMWPLTQAMFTDFDYGFNMDILWEADPNAQTFEYIYGSTPVHDVVEGSMGQDSDVVYRPSELIQFYEKPMSTLYINDISVAINAVKKNRTSLEYSTPKFDSLFLAICDTNMNILATSIATIKDTTKMMYVDGSLVHFTIEEEDEMGFKTIGIAIDEPFIIVLSGLDRPKNNFGIYAGLNLYTGGNTVVVDANSDEIVWYYPADPFIMLNGIYNTLEDGTGVFGYEPYPTDTINIVIENDGEEYIAVCADGEMKGYIPVVAAIDLLRDTTTTLYNYDVFSPDWAELDMEYLMEEDGEVYNMWEESGVYYLYIYGDPSDSSVNPPAIGDEIVLSQYGKKIVYKVVDCPTGLKTITRHINDNKRYNVLGMEVDKNYKGVVIKNGRRFLQ